MTKPDAVGKVKTSYRLHFNGDVWWLEFWAGTLTPPMKSSGEVLRYPAWPANGGEV